MNDFTDHMVTVNAYLAKVSIPVTIRGQQFVSYAEAARHLGVTRQAVSHAARKKLLDKVGLSRVGEKRNCGVKS